MCNFSVQKWDGIAEMIGCGSPIPPSSLASYPKAEKFHGRIFRDFALKQAFRGINFTICMLIFHVCALILTISRINLRELDQIMKNVKF